MRARGIAEIAGLVRSSTDQCACRGSTAASGGSRAKGQRDRCEGLRRPGDHHQHAVAVARGLETSSTIDNVHCCDVAGTGSRSGRGLPGAVWLPAGRLPTGRASGESVSCASTARRRRRSRSDRPSGRPQRHAVAVPRSTRSSAGQAEMTTATGPISVLTCANCGTKNSITPSERGAPHCGKCGVPLPWIVSRRIDVRVETRAARPSPRPLGLVRTFRIAGRSSRTLLGVAPAQSSTVHVTTTRASRSGTTDEHPDDGVMRDGQVAIGSSARCRNRRSAPDHAAIKPPNIAPPA